jgi:hypothetical protein
MGNMTMAAEECRDMWSFLRIERLWQDIRYAARMAGFVVRARRGEGFGRLCQNAAASQIFVKRRGTNPAIGAV